MRRSPGFHPESHGDAGSAVIEFVERHVQESAPLVLRLPNGHQLGFEVIDSVDIVLIEIVMVHVHVVGTIFEGVEALTANQDPVSLSLITGDLGQLIARAVLLDQPEGMSSLKWITLERTRNELPSISVQRPKPESISSVPPSPAFGTAPASAISTQLE